MLSSFDGPGRASRGRDHSLLSRRVLRLFLALWILSASHFIIHLSDFPQTLPNDVCKPDSPFRTARATQNKEHTLGQVSHQLHWSCTRPGSIDGPSSVLRPGFCDRPPHTTQDAQYVPLCPSYLVRAIFTDNISYSASL